MPRRSKFPGLSRKPSGSFVVRMRIPPALRAAAKARHGVEHEWIEALGTDEAAEAERGYPAALARVMAKRDEAALAAAGGAPDGSGASCGRAEGRTHGATSTGFPKEDSPERVAPDATPLDVGAAHRALEAWEAAEVGRAATAILAGRVPHPEDGRAAADAWFDAAHHRSEEICRLTGLDFTWKPPPREKLLEMDRALVDALGRHGVALDVRHPALRLLRAPFRDARVRALRAEHRMHEDWGVGVPPAPPPAPPPVPAPAAQPGANGAARGSEPFSKLVDLYRERRSPEEEVVAPVKRRFTEAMGGDKPCGSVMKDDVIRYRDLLECSPARPSPADEALSLPDLARKHEGGIRRWLDEAAQRRAAAEAWDEDDDDDADASGAALVRPMADQTITKHLNILRSIFERGVEENWLPSNPAAKVVVKERGIRVERVPFTDRDMGILFGGPVHRGMASRRRRTQPGELVVGNADYWLQLLAPLSGARLEELGQALPTDIRDRGGIAYIAITSRDERGVAVKRLKSFHAQRDVPLHPRVLELGFLDYVAAVRRAGFPRLFPDLLVRHRKDGSPIFTRDYSSKRFPRYRAALGIVDPRKPFHSFRHWVKGEMKKTGVEYAKQDALIGHAPPNNAGKGYARNETLPLPAKLEIIEALSFPGLAEVKRPTTWGLPEEGDRGSRVRRRSVPRRSGGPGSAED